MEDKLGPDMSISARKEWAREMVLEILDAALADPTTLPIGPALPVLPFDDRRALEKERDRIAKFFKLPTKYGG